MQTGNSKQSGVALITVMLILALATVLAVSISNRQQVEVHRSANVFYFEQAYQYVSGAEAWSKQILRRDREDNLIDSKNDDWALVLPPLPIEGGKLSGSLEDLQGKFNLNNLVINNKPDPLQLERFKRLLQNLGLNQDLAAVFVDWIDRNELVEFSGAEDNLYLGKSPAYRTANTYFSDVSELLLLNGVDFEVYEKLLPHVCVLESGTKINVNTASAEVLSSLVKDITVEEGKSLVEDRDKEPSKKVEDFLKHPVFKDKKTDVNGLSVSSNFFRLSSQVQIDKINVNFYSVLYRTADGDVIVVGRNRSVL